MDRLPTQTKRYVNSLNLSGQVSHAVLFVRHGYPIEIELACKGKPAGDRGTIDVGFKVCCRLSCRCSCLAHVSCDKRSNFDKAAVQ